MAVSFQDLRYFRAIVDHKSLRAAGDAVGVSQPALSKCLKRLEQVYGGALIDWNGGDSRPTAIGEIVYRDSEEVLFRLANISRQVQHMATGAAGDVRVGMGPYMAEAAGKQAVARFIDESPTSSVSITIAPWNQLVRLLYDKNLDFFVADVGDTLMTGALAVDEIAEQPVSWFVNRSHPLAAKDVVSLKELTSFPICGPEVPTQGVTWLMEVKRLGTGPDQVAPDRHLSVICDNWAILRHFVMHSKCVGVGPMGLYRQELAAGEIRSLNVDIKPYAARFAAVHAKAAPMTPAAERLRAYIAEEVGG